MGTALATREAFEVEDVRGLLLGGLVVGAARRPHGTRAAARPHHELAGGDGLPAR